MSDRLAELARQRALVQEHLAWLDHEIADAALESPTSSAEPASPAGIPSLPSVPPLPRERGRPARIDMSRGGTPTLPNDADPILAQYRVAPATVKEAVRKGCFLYFAAALVVLGLGVVFLYFLVRSR